MKEELKELLAFTYKKSLDDNKEDFIKIMCVISKLCSYLIIKNILTQEEVSKILDLDTDINNLFKSEVE